MRRVYTRSSAVSSGASGYLPTCCARRWPSCCSTLPGGSSVRRVPAPGGGSGLSAPSSRLPAPVCTSPCRAGAGASALCPGRRAHATDPLVAPAMMLTRSSSARMRAAASFGANAAGWLGDAAGVLPFCEALDVEAEEHGAFEVGFHFDLVLA